MTTETTTPQDGEVANGYTEDQAASELLKRWGTDDKPEPSTEGEKPEEPETPEADEATPDATDEPDQEPEESGEVEIDVAGEKFKLPKALEEHAKRIEAKAKEVEAGSTKRFQEAADLRKAAEARAEQVTRMQQIAQAQADLLADHKFVVRRMAAFEQINVNELYQTDPAKLAAINAEYNQLTAAKTRLEQAYQKAVSDYDAETTKAKEARLESLSEFASKNIKGWGADTDKQLNAYVGGKGIERDTMLELLAQEPRLLTILEDAAYGQKVRTAKPVPTPPKPQTLKPGATGTTKPAQLQAVEKANRRLGQTGRVEDAAMALLARANLRKR